MLLGTVVPVCNTGSLRGCDTKARTDCLARWDCGRAWQSVWVQPSAPGSFVRQAESRKLFRRLG